MKSLIITLTLSMWILMAWSLAKAQAFTTDDALHPLAHGAGSYALTHAGQVLCKKVTGLSKTPCAFVSGAVVTSIGIAVEVTQDQQAGDWKRGVAYDVAGIALAVGVIHLDF